MKPTSYVDARKTHICATCGKCHADDPPETWWPTEYECNVCAAREGAIMRAVKLELAARWYDRIGKQPEPDLARYMGLIE